MKPAPTIHLIGERTLSGSTRSLCRAVMLDGPYATDGVRWGHVGEANCRRCLSRAMANA